MQTTGSTIIITGGGTGIGEALAHRFHDLGNTVVIAGRRVETLPKAIGDRPNINALTFDQDDPASIAAFAETLVTDFPGLPSQAPRHSVCSRWSAFSSFSPSGHCASE